MVAGVIFVGTGRGAHLGRQVGIRKPSTGGTARRARYQLWHLRMFGSAVLGDDNLLESGANTRRAYRVGILLVGKGKIWVRNVQIHIVD